MFLFFNNLYSDATSLTGEVLISWSTFPRITVNRRFITNFQGKSLGNVLSCDHSAMHTTVLTVSFSSFSEITTKEEYLTQRCCSRIKGPVYMEVGDPGRVR